MSPLTLFFYMVFHEKVVKKADRQYCISLFSNTNRVRVTGLHRKEPWNNVEPMEYIESRQDIAASVKEQTDIVKIIGDHVELKKSGVRYLGLCPFHGEKTPSFSVNGAQQFYYCFGCGESGDVFSFLMKYHNYDFPEALKYLAGRLGVELPKKRVSQKERQREEIQQQMFNVAKKAAAIYQKCLHDKRFGAPARNYLRERGIPDEIQSIYTIGYAPSKEVAGWDYLQRKLSSEEASTAEKIGLLVKSDRGGRYDRFRDRVLFPIYDTRGRICGFGGRIVGDGQPKYMNSPESPIYNKSRNLLGLYQQIDAIRKDGSVILVEGNFDMISLVVNGCRNVVAPLGTALTGSQVRLLRKYATEATLLFDGDDAGRKAALRAAPLFLAEKLDAKVALLPKGHDPDTYVREVGLNGLQDCLASAKELPEFVVDEHIGKYGLSLQGKSRIAEELKPLVESAPSQLQRAVIIAHFAEKLGVDKAAFESQVRNRGDMAQQKRGDQVAAQKITEETVPLSGAQKRLVEFMILHPNFFAQLEEKNIRASLQGTVGEIIFLQMQMMIRKNGELQPEEILTAMESGAERSFVTDALLNAQQIEAIAETDLDGEEELTELLEWLEGQSLRVISQDLSSKIEQAQHDGNLEMLRELLVEKQRIETELRGDKR